MDPIPITVLAGSDHRPGRLPEGSEGLHPLATYKSVGLCVAGRPLVAVLVERLAACEGFGPVSIAGPAAVHADLDVDAELIDTDGSIADNLRALLGWHAARGHRRVAGLACDVLPSVDELRALRARYDAEAPCAAWIPLVRRPDDDSRLGSFAWKPRYDFLPADGGDPVHLLPGHLTIIEPDALRAEFLLKLLDAAYATRNMPVRPRSRRIARSVLALLLAEDAARLARGRAPTTTWRTLAAGFWLARGLRARTLDLAEVERRIGRIYLTDERRRDAGTPRGLRLPLVDALSLAEDVDTQEEADDLHLDRS